MRNRSCLYVNRLLAQRVAFVDRKRNLLKKDMRMI